MYVLHVHVRSTSLHLHVCFMEHNGGSAESRGKLVRQDGPIETGSYVSL